MNENLSYEAQNLDDETLAKAAEELLTQPSDSHMWDERMYNTHGPIHWWAPDSDDLISESNHHALVAALEPFKGDEDDPDVYTGSVRHWTYSHFEQVLVRVYRDEDRTEYTDAFREATALMLYLRDDYPILDDDDYSTRSWEAFEKTLDEALDWAKRDATWTENYDEVIAEDVAERLLDLAVERTRQEVWDDGQWGHSEDVNWTELQEMFDAQLAAIIVQRETTGGPVFDAAMPGQGVLV